MADSAFFAESDGVVLYNAIVAWHPMLEKNKNSPPPYAAKHWRFYDARTRGGRRFGGRGGSLDEQQMAFKRNKTDFHTLPEVAKFRDELRKNLTPAEAAFWNLVKNSKLDGRKFRRQHSIGKYIFDFYCPSEKLAVELDGAGHFADHPGMNDRSKREYAEARGIRVIRFENKRVFEDAEWVLDLIRSNFGWWKERTTPSAEAASTPPS